MRNLQNFHSHLAKLVIDTPVLSQLMCKDFDSTDFERDNPDLFDFVKTRLLM